MNVLVFDYLCEVNPTLSLKFKKKVHIIKSLRTPDFPTLRNIVVHFFLPYATQSEFHSSATGKRVTYLVGHARVVQQFTTATSREQGTGKCRVASAKVHRVFVPRTELLLPMVPPNKPPAGAHPDAGLRWQDSAEGRRSTASSRDPDLGIPFGR